MKYVALSALLLFGMTACGGPATVGPNGGLRYGVPTTPSVTYVTESSQEIGIDAGAMGTMNMTASSEATLGVTFAAAANGVEVTTTFDDITASMTQPMGGSLSATESDVEGPLVFSMDAKGKGTPITIPSTKGSAEQLIAPVSFVHDFFPRLPGRAVDPGATWTDTISWEFSTAEGDQSTVAVLSYTLVGDTIVDGTSLLNITYVGDMDVVGSGTTEGTEVMQVFSGETGKVVASASTLAADVKKAIKYSGNIDAATAVGKVIAEKAKAAGIETVAFDRSGFKYHGRVKALAESARENGLKF